MDTFGPLVPYFLGFALVITFGILIVGIFSFAFSRDFNRKYANKLMRARVIAQAVAVALFATLVYVVGNP